MIKRGGSSKLSEKTRRAPHLPRLFHLHFRRTFILRFRQVKHPVLVRRFTSFLCRPLENPRSGSRPIRNLSSSAFLGTPRKNCPTPIVGILGGVVVGMFSWSVPISGSGAEVVTGLCTSESSPVGESGGSGGIESSTNGGFAVNDIGSPAS